LKLMKYTEIEAIILKKEIKKKEIEERIKELGNSLVIGEIKDYYKIHIHTNYPEKVIEELKKISEIVDLKKTPLP